MLLFLSFPGTYSYFGPSRRPPPGLRMRVVTFCVSTFGAFGAEAQALLRAVSRRVGGTVPPALADQSSWAAPRAAPFARQIVSLALRRSLASALRDPLTAAEAAALAPRDAAAGDAGAPPDDGSSPPFDPPVG